MATAPCPVGQNKRPVPKQSDIDEAVRASSPRLRKAMHDELLAKINSGMHPDQAAASIVADSGGKLDTRYVLQMALAPRGAQRTKEALGLNRARLDMERAIRQTLYRQTQTLPVTILKGAPYLASKIKLFGHGVPLFGTHTKPLITAFNTPLDKYLGLETPNFNEIWRRNWGRAYQYGFAPDRVNIIEADKRAIRNHPDYLLARSVGGKVDPDADPFSLINPGPTKGRFRDIPRAAFVALAKSRMEMWDEWKSRLPNPEFVTREEAKMMWDHINHASGAANIWRGAGGVWSNITFAPQLSLAKRAVAIVDPMKDLGNLIVHYYSKMKGGGTLTDNELSMTKDAMKLWGKGVGYGMALLAGSAAFQKYWMHDDEHPVNFTNFSDLSTFWRPRFGKYVMPGLPIVEALRIPAVFMATLMASKRTLRGENPVHAALGVAGRDLLSILNPLYIDLLGAATGRDPFTQQRSPLTGASQLVRGVERVGLGEVVRHPVLAATGRFGEEPETQPRQSWAELATLHLPIQGEAFFEDVVSTIEQQGYDHQTAVGWTIALSKAGAIALFAGAGEHVFEREERRPQLRKLPRDYRQMIQQQNIRERLF